MRPSLFIDTPHGRCTVRELAPLGTPAGARHDVVVALHSSGSEARQWSGLGSAWPDRRVLAPELFGHPGDGPWRGASPLHFDVQVEATVRLLETLDEPATLIGHSLGGLVALKAALRVPARVRGLGLYEPVVFGVLHDAPARLDDAERLMRSFDDWDPAAPEIFCEAFVGYWSGDEVWSILPPHRRDALLEVAQGMHDEARAVTFDRTPGATYAALTMPAVVVHGTTSPPASTEMAHRLVAQLPNAERVVIEGAPHMGCITHPDRFEAAIAPLLR